MNRIDPQVMKELFKNMAERELHVEGYNPGNAEPLNLENPFIKFNGENIKETYEQIKDTLGPNIIMGFDETAKQITLSAMPHNADELFSKLSNVMKEPLTKVPTEDPLDMEDVSKVRVNGQDFVKIEKQDGESEIVKDQSILSVKEQYQLAKKEKTVDITDDGKVNSENIFADMKQTREEVKLEKTPEINTSILSRDEQVGLNAVNKISEKNKVVGNSTEGLYVDKDKDNKVRHVDVKDDKVEVRNPGEQTHENNQEVAVEPLDLNEDLTLDEMEKEYNIRKAKRTATITDLAARKEKIEEYKKAMAGRSLKLTKNPGDNRAAFADALILSLVTGFAAGVVFVISYLQFT